jgi:hypothetical protein
VVEDVSYLTLQGANDADVSSFGGSRQWERIVFTRNGPSFKAEIYAYNANHGQFNTVWGRTDMGTPLNWFFNLKPLMAGDEQRRISKTYISAFLEATLHGRRQYIAMFRDYRAARDWIPDTYYMSRYLDATYHPISNYTEDPDVTTTTVPGGHIEAENLSIWKEGRIPARSGDRDYNGVFLGWNREKQPDQIPSYTIAVPEGMAQRWNLQDPAVLTMSLAVTEDKAPLPGKHDEKDDKKNDTKKKDDPNKKAEPTDFTVELESSDGVKTRFPLSKYGVLQPPFKVRFTKFAQMDDVAYNKASEPIFQTFDLPLTDFGIDAAKLKAIRLIFDKTQSRVVIMSQIGLASRE